MADLRETWARHAQDVVNNNMGGLMGDFAPAVMPSVMALAANPLIATSFEVNDLGNNEAEITYIGATRRTIWSRWEESDGRWQITGLAERTA